MVPVGSEKVPGDRYKNGASVSVQKCDQDRFEKGTSIGTEKGPVDRFKKGTNRKKNSKVDNKQHDVVVHVLKKEGFSARAARHIADASTQEVVEQQIAWLPYRDPSSNPLGMLRKAILENWSEPSQLFAERKEEVASQAAEQQAQQERDRVSLDLQSWKKKASSSSVFVRRQLQRRAASSMVRRYTQSEEDRI